MKKSLTKDQLHKDADRLMKANKVDEIYAVSDGNYFLKRHEAVTHCNEMNRDRLEDKFEVIPFSKKETVKQVIKDAIDGAKAKIKAKAEKEKDEKEPAKEPVKEPAKEGSENEPKQ